MAVESNVERANRIISSHSAKPEDVEFSPTVGFLDPGKVLTRQETAQVAAMGDRSLKRYPVLVAKVVGDRGKMVPNDRGGQISRTQRFLQETALAANSVQEIGHKSVLEMVGPGPDEAGGDSPIAIEGFSVLATLLALCREDFWSFEAASSRAIPYPRGYYRTPEKLAKTKIGDRLASLNGEVHYIYEQLLKRALGENVRDLPQKTEDNARRVGGLEWMALNQSLDAARQVTNLTFLQRLSAHPNDALALRETITKLRGSKIPEVRFLGSELQRLGEQAFPTMMTHVDPSRFDLQAAAMRITMAEAMDKKLDTETGEDGPRETKLTRLRVSENSEVEFLTAFVASESGTDRQVIKRRMERLGKQKRSQLLRHILGEMTLHDRPPHELNVVRVRMQMDMSVGGIFDATRHRTAMDIVPTLRPGNGFVVPEIFRKLNLVWEYEAALKLNREAYSLVSGLGADYARVFARYFVSRADIIPGYSFEIGGADFFHLAKLRASAHTHADLSAPMYEAVELAAQQSAIFEHVVLKK